MLDIATSPTSVKTDRLDCPTYLPTKPSFAPVRRRGAAFAATRPGTIGNRSARLM